MWPLWLITPSLKCTCRSVWFWNSSGVFLFQTYLLTLFSPVSQNKTVLFKYVCRAAYIQHSNLHNMSFNQTLVISSPHLGGRITLYTLRLSVRCPSVLRLYCLTPIKGKGKGAYSSSWNSPQNYGMPLVNGITQCYLPPDRGDRSAFTPTGQVSTRFIDPVRMKGWVGLVGWLHTEMVYPSRDGHPSWY